MVSKGGMRKKIVLTALLGVGCGPSIASGDGDQGGTRAEVGDTADTGESPGMDDTGGEPGSDAGQDTTGEPTPDCDVDFSRLLPDQAALYQGVIARSCSPFDNVCHRGEEYPELGESGSLVELIGAPCNLAVDDPEEILDRCESQADRVLITADAGDWETEVAWHMLDEVDDVMVIALREPLPFDPGDLPSLWVAAPGEAWDEIAAPILAAPGSDLVTVQGFNAMTTADRDRMLALVDGDPNRNGTFGFEQGPGYLMIAPGDPASSYLMLRILGEVPGSKMPLANQPVSEEELVALACWIEGTAAPGGDALEAAIDYQSCEYAHAFYCE